MLSDDFSAFGLYPRHVPQRKVSFSLETLSVCKVIPIGMETGIQMPSATGFFLENNGDTFLVTNRHVVTARDFFRPERHLFNGSTPGKLVLHCFLYKELGDGNYAYGDALYTLDLFGDDRPKYILPEDPDRMDVAVMWIGKDQNLREQYDGFSFCTLKVGKMSPRVMDSVIVAGYPETGIFSEAGYCVFKGGIIASEPDMDFKGGVVLIDANTKRGMSGSPIFHKPPNVVAHHAGLIGVYSGRDEDGEITGNSELGLMWPIDRVVHYLENFGNSGISR